MKTTPSIVLIGLIGIGKTTIASKLKGKLQERHGIVSETLFEPVEQWKESGLLQHFYDDPTRWAYTLQQKAFSSRLQLFSKVDWSKTELTISDGSILMDRHAFAEMLHEDGRISDFEMSLYLDTFQEWRTLVPAADPSIFVYLKTDDTKVALDRIKVRDRKEESGISPEYMEKLKDKIEAMLEIPMYRHRVIVVDATQKEGKVINDIYDALCTKDFVANIPSKKEQ